MAGSVILTNNFGSATSPLLLSEFDTNFAQLTTAVNALATYSNVYLDTGPANNWIINLASPQTVSYSLGLNVQVKVGNTISGPCTINVNGLGVKNVVNPDLSSLSAAQVIAGSIVDLFYDGNQFQVNGGTVALNAGRSWVKVKTAPTARSAATLLIDPDLQVAVSTAGYFLVHVYATQTSNGANGLKFLIQPTVAGAYTFHGNCWLNGSSFIFAETTGTTAGTAASASGDYIDSWALVQTYSAGSIGLYWQPNTSGSTTTIGATSCITVNQLA